MKIAILNPEWYFSFFYILAFLVSQLMIIGLSLKRSYSLKTILIMLTNVNLLSIIGSRLFTIPVSEWLNVLASGSISEYAGRSAIGALLFALTGLLISQKIFSLNKPILDSFAWVTPICLGLQKMGCLFNGCCYGKPSDIYWSIQYPKGTQAHYSHWAIGAINENAGFSLSVHPVQLYEVLILFALAWFVWRMRNKWKKVGSSLFFALFLFFIFRFFIEFIRDPSSSQFNTSSIFGVRIFVWLILLAGIIFGLLLFIYEKYLNNDIIYSSTNRLQTKALIINIFTISLVIYLFHKLLTYFELIAILTNYIPVLILTGIYIYKTVAEKKYLSSFGLILVLPFILMSQSIPQDTTIKSSYKRIDFGTSIGSAYSKILSNPTQGECGTQYSEEDYQNKYRIVGIGYSRTKIRIKSKTSLGINLSYGINQELNLTKNQKSSQNIFGINPYLRYDRNWIGMGTGVIAGSNRYIPSKPINEFNYASATKSIPLLPEFYLRVGRRDILYIDYSYLSIFPSPFPGYLNNINIGSGFGQKENFNLKFGYSLPRETMNISAEALFNKKWGLNVTCIFGNEMGKYEKLPASFLFGVNLRLSDK